MGKLRFQLDDHYTRALAQVLEEFGVADYRLEPGSKHRHLVFELAGREVRLAVPGSTNDWSGHLSFKTRLRRRCRAAVGCNPPAAD